MSQLIQFEGETVAVIAPEDLEEMEEELATLRARVKELEAHIASGKTHMHGLDVCAYCAEGDLARKDAPKHEALVKAVRRDKEMSDAIWEDIDNRMREGYTLTAEDQEYLLTAVVWSSDTVDALAAFDE